MDIFSPIAQFSAFFTQNILGIPIDSYLGRAVDFFLYDLIKISLLLIVINYVMAISRYYFPMEKVRSILTGRRWYGLDYLLAAIMGAVTPFCSCSSIPLFIGFLSAGIPVGVTFTFLISSPLVNESSLFLFPAIFGWKITILYNIIGILISMVGGMIIGRLKMEKYVRSEFTQFTPRETFEAQFDQAKIPIRTLLKHWLNEALDITKQIYPYMVLGVGIGALIHGYVPQTFIIEYLSADAWWVVPLAVGIGAPLYANSVTVIPIAQALVGKGVPMGAALAFMTATVTLSLPEALMLKKVMRWQLLAAFFAVTILGILIIGYLFNWLS